MTKETFERKSLTDLHIQSYSTQWQSEVMAAGAFGAHFLNNK